MTSFFFLQQRLNRRDFERYEVNSQNRPFSIQFIVSGLYDFCLKEIFVLRNHIYHRKKKESSGNYEFDKKTLELERRLSNCKSWEIMDH